MKKKRPQSISLKDFIKSLPPEERRRIKERAKYYELLFAFRHARKSRGITQAELAAKADVNRTTLIKVESGERNATLDVLMRMANAMNMSLKISLI